MNRKCPATGKTTFSSPEDARTCMLSFRHKLKIKVQGKRVKRRIGKPEQKRSYWCRYCEGYHLTSWEIPKNKKAAEIIKNSKTANEEILERIKNKKYLPYPDNHGKVA